MHAYMHADLPTEWKLHACERQRYGERGFEAGVVDAISKFEGFEGGGRIRDFRLSLFMGGC